MIEVSLVITTRNEESNIRNCLESIKKQNYPLARVEIIVVDNNSSDNTKAIAAEYTQKVYDYGPERASQRNFGVKNATGNYILYLDADMILSENVLQECVRKCNDSGFDALYIPERIIGRGFWIKVRDFERSFYNGTCIDCVRFVRRDKFIEINGFDEALTGPEDWDFDMRIRRDAKVCIIDSPIYHNENSLGIRKYIRKKAYYANSFKKYIDKWGVANRDVKRQLGLRYRYFGVFIENGKWVRLIKHPLLAFGLYYLRFLVGLTYLTNILFMNKLRINYE